MHPNTLEALSYGLHMDCEKEPLVSGSSHVNKTYSGPFGAPGYLGRSIEVLLVRPCSDQAMLGAMVAMINLLGCC